MLVLLMVSLVMFFTGLTVYSLKHNHLLIMLLSLEFIVLSLYLNLFIYLSMNDYNFFFSMLFITMSVSEGALGLSVLVSMIRVWGNDYVLTFSFLW